MKHLHWLYNSYRWCYCRCWGMRTENKTLEQIKASWFLDVFSIILVQFSLFLDCLKQMLFFEQMKLSRRVLHWAKVFDGSNFWQYGGCSWQFFLRTGNNCLPVSDLLYVPYWCKTCSCLTQGAESCGGTAGKGAVQTCCGLVPAYSKQPWNWWK